MNSFVQYQTWKVCRSNNLDAGNMTKSPAKTHKMYAKKNGYFRNVPVCPPRTRIAASKNKQTAYETIALIDIEDNLGSTATNASTNRNCGNHFSCLQDTLNRKGTTALPGSIAGRREGENRVSLARFAQHARPRRV